MKKKKLLLTGLILLVPFVSKASKLEDIKDIRGEKNHFEDLMLDNLNMFIDISEYEKHGMDPKESGLNIDSKNEIHIDASDKNNDKSQANNDDIIAELNNKPFLLMSGAGGWSTDLNFLDDKGNFEVKYTDFNHDKSYASHGKGKFTVDKKVNETCYILNLSEFEVISPTGTTETQNGHPVEYVPMPHGMEAFNSEDKACKKFTLYLPKRKRSEMSKEVNEWINASGGSKYINDYESRVFILVNNETVLPFIEGVE